MSKNHEITAAIATHLRAGLSIREAIESVFGAGAYESITGHVYDALKAKIAAA